MMKILINEEEYSMFMWGLPRGPLVGAMILPPEMDEIDRGTWSGDIRFGILPGIHKYEGNWRRVRSSYAVFRGHPVKKKRRRRRRKNIVKARYALEMK